MRTFMILVLVAGIEQAATAQLTSSHIYSIQRAHSQFHSRARSHAKKSVRNYQPTYRMLTRKYNKSRRAQYLMEGLTPEEQAIRQERIRRYYRKRALMRR